MLAISGHMPIFCKLPLLEMWVYLKWLRHPLWLWFSFLRMWAGVKYINPSWNPSRLEPTDIYRSDGKCPDGASIVPWKGGRVLFWDATCPTPWPLLIQHLQQAKLGRWLQRWNEGEVFPSWLQPFLYSNGSGDIGGDGARGRSLL